MPSIKQVLHQWCFLLSLLLLLEIGIRGGMTIPWNFPIDCSRQMKFLPRGGNESLRVTVLLIAFLYLLCKGFNFSSSGREDVDVRTLGNGKIATAPLD